MFKKGSSLQLLVCVLSNSELIAKILWLSSWKHKINRSC